MGARTSLWTALLPFTRRRGLSQAGCYHPIQSVTWHGVLAVRHLGHDAALLEATGKVRLFHMHGVERGSGGAKLPLRIDPWVGCRQAVGWLRALRSYLESLLPQRLLGVNDVVACGRTCLK